MSTVAMMIENAERLREARALAQYKAQASWQQYLNEDHEEQEDDDDDEALRAVTDSKP